MLEQIAPPAVPARRAWAASSAWAGAAWLLLAMAPIPGTTLIGLPFAGYALIVGAISWVDNRQAHDRPGARRATLGMGLGCAGFLWLTGVYLVLGAAVVLAIVTALHSHIFGAH